jgi:hypothetical protein
MGAVLDRRIIESTLLPTQAWTVATRLDVGVESGFSLIVPERRIFNAGSVGKYL